MAKLDESRPFIPVRIAVLTVSDTRTPEDDRSGAALAEMIREAGHELVAKAIVKDEVAAIRSQVQAWIADAGVDVVISTGGTGFTGRDVTPEAVKPLFEKEVEGFSIVFHMISYAKIATSTIQSRACAGVAQGTYIFCLPGSPGACRDAWNEILKWQLDNRHRPCNFVEIMPRLEEHRRGKPTPAG
jgi:molybdenum cofactor biosynthesis protein B